MKYLRSPASPYILAFVLPVAIAELLAGGLNLLSFIELRNDHLAVVAEADQDQKKLTLNRNINNEIAAVQLRAADLLEQARVGKIDQAGAYRMHSQLVNQLAALEQQLVQVKEAIGEENLRDLQQHFRDYRSAILHATDLAVIDPSSAMSRAYQATLSQQHISQQVRVVAAGLNDRMAQRSKAREKSFQAHAIQNAVVGGVLVLVLIVVWVRLILRLSGRLATLTSALDDLANGVVDPPTLPSVRTLADCTGSLLGKLAHAVLCFRQTSMSHHKAQYDLGERMKELSCLFDVLQITARDDIDNVTMFEFVAARLASAMRFPDIAVGCIECEGKHYGTLVEGEQLSASFVGIDGQPSRVIVTYRLPLPADAGSPFLAEEQTLLDAIAAHLAAAVERHRIAAAERDWQALVKAVIAEAPDAIELVDRETLRFVEVNAMSCHMLGYSREEMLGMHVADIQSALTSEQLAAIVQVIADSGSAQFENQHRCKDGTLIDVSINVRAIRQNERDYLVCIWRDITDKKRMSDELERHRLHLEELVASRTQELDAALQEQEALFEAASVGIVLLRDRIIMRCNRTLDDMFGYDAGEQIGQNVRIWYPEEATYTQAGEEVYGRGNRSEVHTAERDLVRKDGSHLWARMSVRTVDITGLSKDMVCIVEDITQEREVMAEISRRVYKQGMPHDPAAAIILAGKGTHFDPDMIDAFRDIQAQFQDIATRFADTDLSS